MFTATLYRIIKKLGTTQCPSTGKRINKFTFRQWILLTSTKEQSSNNQNDVDKSQKNAEWKKSNAKE